MKGWIKAIIPVLVVIASLIVIVIIGWELGFIRTMYVPVAKLADEMISAEPDPVAASANNPLTLSRDYLIISGNEGTEYSEIIKVGFYNTLDEPLSVSPSISCKGISIIGQESSTKEIIPGNSGTLITVFRLNLQFGNYICTVKADDKTKDLLVQIKEQVVVKKPNHLLDPANIIISSILIIVFLIVLGIYLKVRYDKRNLS